MTARDREELLLLQKAASFHWWRWRSELKRLQRTGTVGRWDLHMHELQALHTVWSELRREAGFERKLPARVRRASNRVFWSRCREVIREIEDEELS